jgi:exportin-2 (importin alpha re-exporter)
MNRNALEQYFTSIMQIILTRLQNKKSENLTLRFVRFYHFISAHDEKGYSADFFIQITDRVQDGYVSRTILNLTC